jgi:hypothetical protein
LEDRITGALKCQSGYGIFQKYLHRNLLWQASDDKLKEIAYDHHVPSWSWMANSGGIQFMHIPFGEVDWIDHLRFDEECEFALIADVAEFRNCTMKLDGDHYEVLDLSRRKRGWIRYDAEDGKELGKERCVVVGRKRNITEYYILVVRPTRVDGLYRRVGVGSIHSGYVVRHRINMRVV